jgi:hypothetical protein
VVDYKKQTLPAPVVGHSYVGIPLLLSLLYSTVTGSIRRKVVKEGVYLPVDKAGDSAREKIRVRTFVI